MSLHRLGWISAMAPALWALASAANAQGGSGATGCEALASSKAFKQTSITSARWIAADAAHHTPAFCEVVAVVKPVEGSNIGVTYRMPERWNGKLLGLGGGGWAGNMTREAATPGLADGYATAQTNGGHEVIAGNVWDTASWALNPPAATDFAYRAIHVMTDVGKAVVVSYYGKPHSHAYFQGCSTGGRQALMEVQRYPKDYDGVISGAPVYSFTTQTMSLVRNATFAKPGANLSEAQLKRLNDSALAKCDRMDGVADGVVTDPRQCTFDPAELQCKAGSSDPTCLSETQMKTVRALYTGVKAPDGQYVSYPLTRGSEAGWSRFISTASAATDEMWLNGPAGAGLGGLRPIVFNDPNFDLKAFNPAKDYRTIRGSAFAGEYEAKNPDISAFINNGGKLLLWHGFDDPGPSALGTLEYFAQVTQTTGPKVKSLDDNARLFLLPGVYHCRGGPGADVFDGVKAMDEWVTKSKAPTRLLATRTDGAFSRPLCVYPQLAHYDGKGDPKSADSFSCD